MPDVVQEYCCPTPDFTTPFSEFSSRSTLGKHKAMLMNTKMDPYTLRLGSLFWIPHWDYRPDRIQQFWNISFALSPRANSNAHSPAFRISNNEALSRDINHLCGF
jgi:hypothetical protein